MSIWAKNSSEFLGFLTGFDGRDAFSKHQRFSVVRHPNTVSAVERSKLPLEAQNNILTLIYEVMGLLRKWLQEGSNETLPTVRELLDDPKVDFSMATQSMVNLEVDGSLSDDSPKFVVLERAVKALVTEAYIERIRNEFVDELERSLKVFQARLEKNCADDNDWRNDLDGGVVLYDVFRPNLWDIYQEFWDKWNADMERIHTLATHLQRLDETLKQNEEDL